MTSRRGLTVNFSCTKTLLVIIPQLSELCNCVLSLSTISDGSDTNSGHSLEVVRPTASCSNVSRATQYSGPLYSGNSPKGVRKWEVHKH